MNTAVEWIEETIGKDNMGNFLKDVLEKAKEMEKEQIMDAFNQGFATPQWDKEKENKAKQYYEKTFKSE